MMTLDRVPGVGECVRLVDAGEVSATELTRLSLDLIAEHDPDVQAFTTVDVERALAAAALVDRGRSAGGPFRPLAGVPLGVKDVIAAEGLPTSYGSSAIPPVLAQRDARCVGRLRAAGAVPIGMTRTSELAWVGDTPPTVNPRWPQHVCGGSSGGSAAAVAAGLVSVALGTDTGGSVRWPAVACGAVGIKPTHGAVPLEGVLPCSWSLDHVGPIAGSVDDVRRVLAVLADEPVDLSAQQPAGVVRLGVLDTGVFGPLGDHARNRFDRTLDEVVRRQCELERLDVPEGGLAQPALTAISLADGAALWPKVSRGEIPESLAVQLELGRVIPGGLVQRAQQVRVLIRRRVRDLFRAHRLDALLTPASIAALPRRGCSERLLLGDGATVEALEASSRPFALANATGQPAVVLPLAPDDDGPFSIQLIGRPFCDDALLQIAARVQEAVGS